MDIQQATSDPAFVERLMAKVDKSGDCWVYTGTLDVRGYGLIGLGPKWKDRTHRIAIVLDGRDLPPGRVVHHTCRNKACCNPAHLQVLTQAEHNAIHRAEDGPRPMPGCRKHGNSEMGQRTAGPRYCLICKREQSRRSRAKKAAMDSSAADRKAA